MINRSGMRIGIGAVILLAFGSVSPAKAQWNDGPQGDFTPDTVYHGSLKDWRTIDAQIYTQLERADLSQLANAQKRAKPTRDPAQLMERLDIFVRAGDRRYADLILQALGHTALAQDTFQGGMIADFLIQHGEWDLARHLIEICPRIDITTVPTHRLLESILKQNPYPSSYWLQDGVLQIGLQDNAPQEKAATPPMNAVNPVTTRALQHLSVDLRNLDLTLALQRVCDLAKISYVLALQGCKTQKVTLALKEVPLDQALQGILAAASPSPPLHSQLQRGVVMVFPESGPLGEPVVGSKKQKERLESRVTARFRDLDLRLSLHALIGVLRFNYYIDTGTGSRTSLPSVRLAVANVPAQDLMRRLLKQSRYPLSYWIENDVFAVGPRDNAPK